MRDQNENESVTLRASLFGVFQLITSDGQEVAISNRRAKAILAMLCLVPEEPIEREYLSKLLWPGRFEAQARASLRQCLLELNKVFGALGCTMLDVTRSRIALNAPQLQTDVDALHNALASGHYGTAADMLGALGNKPLLDQMHFGDDFAGWLQNHRPQIELRLKVAANQALDHLQHNGDPDVHARLLDAWRVRDPTPNPLANPLASPLTGHQDIASRKDGKLRLAVLPFRSMAIPDDGGFFADGIVDELITTLGQVPQLLVAGRTSSFHFKGSDMSLPEIAATLNVSYLVEGSVQRQDEQVRINVSLIDGASGFELWSYSYDGSFDHIFDTREDVAQAVNGGIADALGLPSHTPKARSLTASREAYGLYLQGRALTIRAIGDGVLDKAIELLERALDIDPDFAECWTALAEAQINVTVYTPCLDRLERAAKAAIYAEKAIALDPLQGHARTILAIHKWTENDIVGALDLAFEAYRLEPNHPDVVNRVGSFLTYCGRSRDALPYLEASIDQDPVNGRSYAVLCGAQLNLGNIAEAQKAGQRMVDLGFPSMWLALVSFADGRNDLAVEQYQQTRLLMNTVIFAPAGSTPMSPQAMDAYWLMAAKGLFSGEAGQRENYCLVVDMLHATLPDKADTTIVIPAVWMGYADMLFKSLGRQITPANFFALMSLWADIEPIRQIRLDPGFMQFAQRIGLVAAWEKYGWPDLLPRPANVPDQSPQLAIAAN